MGQNLYYVLLKTTLHHIHEKCIKRVPLNLLPVPPKFQTWSHRAAAQDSVYQNLALFTEGRLYDRAFCFGAY